MKQRFLAFTTALLVLLTAAPSFAADKGDKQAMTVEQMRARVSEARQNDERLIVMLKDGQSISGKIQQVTDDHFVIQQLGAKTAHIVKYADVAALRKRNKFVVFAKTTGMVALAPVAVPLYLILQLSAAITGHPQGLD